MAFKNAYALDDIITLKKVGKNSSRGSETENDKKIKTESDCNTLHNFYTTSRWCCARKYPKFVPVQYYIIISMWIILLKKIINCYSF